MVVCSYVASLKGKEGRKEEGKLRKVSGEEVVRKERKCTVQSARHGAEQQHSTDLRGQATKLELKVGHSNKLQENGKIRCEF